MRRLAACAVVLLVSACAGPPRGGSQRPAESTAASSTSAQATSAPPSAPAPVDGEIVVDTVEEIRAALASARPGDVIHVADGEYTFKPRLVATASGTPTSAITLQGSRAALLRTKNASGDYGLSITGDYWRIVGLTVAHAS